MPLSVATHCSSCLMNPSLPPPPVLHLFFVLLSSFLSFTSLSIVLLVTHLLVFFLTPTFARNYPPRNLPFLTHVTTSPSSSSHYFFSLYYSSLSLSPVLCFYFLSIYSSPTPFFHGNQRFFFPSTFNNHSLLHLFSFRKLILQLAFPSLKSFFTFILC
ncbi:hypothetical protein K457DRAFT_883232 [Linnemannia elongata AG-77]|uniref:Uncharacterized protein n=1 Tax=Linnemannia elongata AG-77 TaxID=1314771 RepID=A0A197JHY1_9FUNG|nr:hypothetical protein K457DRAFT_883232 [Linnemannia elongata AG-77]